MKRNDDFIKLLIEKEELFWQQIATRTPPDPDDSPVTKEALKRLYPVGTGETTDLPEDAYQWHYMRENAKEIKKAAEAKILFRSRCNPLVKLFE